MTIGAATDLRPLLAQVASGRALSESEAEAAFDIMMNGDATPAQMGAFLMALRVRGETVEEITGAARIMRAKALAIEAPPGAIDTFGTGGDGSGTYKSRLRALWSSPGAACRSPSTATGRCRSKSGVGRRTDGARRQHRLPIGAWSRALLARPASAS